MREQAVENPRREDGSSTGPEAIMDRASAALTETRYFEAIAGCREALRLARAAGDFALMSRIVLPLLEAHRQIRQLAVDAAHGDGVCVAGKAGDMPDPMRPGCYLLRPPFLGVDGGTLRTGAGDAELPVFVLVREPANRAGLCPVVGVGRRVVRIRIGAYEGDTPSIEWFEDAAEQLGDQAIRDAEADGVGGPTAFLVDDLLDRLDAAPEHEKLHQRLAEACEAASREPVPTERRRRPLIDDPNSF